MALEVSQIADEVKPLDIPLGGGTLHVEYYPGRLTRRTDRAVLEKARAFDAQVKSRDERAKDKGAKEKDAEDGDDPFFSPNAERLCLLLASWDLVNKGKPVPIEPQSFVDYLGHLNTAKIIEALYADRDLPNAKNS